MENSKPLRQTPTDRMLMRARKIAAALDLTLPEEAEQNFDACSAFIDEWIEKEPATEAQIGFAERLARAEGVEIPDEVRQSKKKMTEWISAHQDG